MNESDDIISDFFTQVRMILGAQVLPDEAAQQIEKKLRDTWGGQPAYIYKKEIRARDKAALVRAEFNGCNRKELQEKYGISKSQFYAYLKGG